MESTCSDIGVCVHTRAQMPLHELAWKPSVNLEGSSSIALYLICFGELFLRQSLSLNVELTILAQLTGVREPQDLCISIFPALELQNSTASGLSLRVRIQTQAPLLAQ